MRLHPFKKAYINWSLETTAEILTKRFGPEALIVVVRPSEYHLGTFSKFTNFVSTDEESSPIYCRETDKAWRQLDDIMEEVHKGIERENPIAHLNCEAFLDTPIAVVGFSKGCVVLNQLLHETVHLRNVTQMESKSPIHVHKMFWLDGGHNGTSDTWVTDESVIKSFADFYTNSAMEIFVHVTPYQMNDDNRPHIGRQKAIFCQLAKRNGLVLNDKTHFENEKRAIEIHFEILSSF